MKRDLILAYGFLMGEGLVGSGCMLAYGFDHGRIDMGAVGASLLITIAVFSAYVRLHACFLDRWEEPLPTEDT